MVPKLLVYEALVKRGVVAARWWWSPLFEGFGLIERLALLVCSLALTLLALFLAATR